MGASLFYLMEASKHWYCVPQSQVLSTTPALVRAGQRVKFKYSPSLVFEGTVKFISRSESKVNREISLLAKSAKRRNSDSSFEAARPRKAAVKQREWLQQVMGRSKRLKSMSPSLKKEKHGKKSKRSSKKREVESLRKRAAEAAEMELDKENNSPLLLNNDIKFSGSRDGEGNLSSKADEGNLLKVREASIGSKAGEDPCSGLKDDNAALSEQCGSEPRLSLSSSSVVTSTPNKHPASDVKTIRDMNDHGANSSLETTLECSFQVDEKLELSLSRTPSASSNSDSESSSEEEHRVKKSKSRSKKYRSRKYRSKKYRSKKYKSKKSKNSKRRRRYSSSESDSESSSSSSSSASESDEPRSPRRRAKAVKRNTAVYSACNYICKADDEGVEKLCEPYDVYVHSKDLMEALEGATSVTQFIRQITPKIYTEDALRNATPMGFPDRSKGRSHNRLVLPRLHPEGRLAILSRAAKLEDSKKSWRPRVGEAKMRTAFSGIVNKFKEM